MTQRIDIGDDLRTLVVLDLDFFSTRTQKSRSSTTSVRRSSPNTCSAGPGFFFYKDSVITESDIFARAYYYYFLGVYAMANVCLDIVIKLCVICKILVFVSACCETNVC